MAVPLAFIACTEPTIDGGSGSGQGSGSNSGNNQDDIKKASRDRFANQTIEGYANYCDLQARFNPDALNLPQMQYRLNGLRVAQMQGLSTNPAHTYPQSELTAINNRMLDIMYSAIQLFQQKFPNLNLSTSHDILDK